MFYDPQRDRSVFAVMVLIAGTALLAPLPALTHIAVASKTSWHPSFAQLDRNFDGYVDATEAAALPALAEALPRLDRNGDGKLDKIEFAHFF
jgi:hypothetical protein